VINPDPAPAIPGLPPCILFEDDHLLVAAKPPGWNTHAPSPFAGEGLYEWLRHREPRWAGLALIHRLDKDTSGVIVFAKTPLASCGLTRAFAERRVHKRYLLLTDRLAPQEHLTRRSILVRIGNRYASTRAPDPRAGTFAETAFRPLDPAAAPGPDLVALEAIPATGRTHQIRVHAAEAGFPILGDTLYGGTPAARLHLHAAAVAFTHPASGQPVEFTAPVDWFEPASLALRRACIDMGTTDAFRIAHGAADGAPGWYVDRLGPCLLVHADSLPNSAQLATLADLHRRLGTRTAFFKPRLRQIRQTSPAAAAPRPLGPGTDTREVGVLENGLRFLLRLDEGYSTGLFLDQRDNRRRLRVNHVAAGFPVCPAEPARCAVLNLFAYTCAFSVCAAAAGAQTTSVDLSGRYLDWGRRHFAANGLDPDRHAFLRGDVFDWLRRLAKRGQRFEVVLLDPPTFSTSRRSGRFRAEDDLGALADLALPVLAPGGVLFASTNAARLGPDAFLAILNDAVARAGRRVLLAHYSPQPPDFPASRAEPAYLKTAWFRVT
jgi:23S rRNA (cytosine1962-C5)-methyltransferase